MPIKGLFMLLPISLAPIGQGHLDSPTHNPDTGVCHHHVQPAESPLCRFDHSRPGLFEGYVMMQKDRRAAGAADLIHNQLTARVIEVLTSILAPSRARVTAHSAPIPDAPPVTIATLF